MTQQPARRCIDEGIQLRAGTDSEVAAKAIGSVTQKTHHLREGIRYAMQYMEGAYASVLAQTPTRCMRSASPNGIRPLCIRQAARGSRLGGFQRNLRLGHRGAEYVRDVEPGEIVRLARRVSPPSRASSRASVPAAFRVRVLRPPRLRHGRPVGLPGASQHGPHSWPARRRPTPTWCSACPTAASRRRWASPSKAASRTPTAS